MDNIGRREVLVGGGTITAGAVILNQPPSILGDEFVEGIDREIAETEAEKLRNQLLRSEDFLLKLDLPIPQRIEDYGYNTGKSSVNPKVTEKGVRVTDNFYLSSFDGEILQGEVDGESYTYHHLESAENVNNNFDELDDLLDVTDDGYSELALSGDESSGNLGRLNQTLEDFNRIRAFTRVEDQQPFLTEQSIEELKEVNEEIENSLTEYTEFLNSYQGSPSQIYESATSLVRQLETAETSTHRRIPLIGVVTGEEEIHNLLSLEERNNLLEGEGGYEGIGLKSTQERSEDLVLDATLTAGKASVIHKVIDDAVRYAEENNRIYSSPEQNQEQSSGKGYRDGLDEESQEVVETYFSDAMFETDRFNKEEVYLEDGTPAKIGVEGYENDLRLTEENSFSHSETEWLKENENQLETVFEEILK